MMRITITKCKLFLIPTVRISYNDGVGTDNDFGVDDTEMEDGTENAMGMEDAAVTIYCLLVRKWTMTLN
jgi:hypothetical protein